MLTKDDLEQIGKVVEEKIQASEARLTKKIDDSQEHTITVLKELIHIGYEMHEERIKHLEDQAEQPHKN